HKTSDIGHDSWKQIAELLTHVYQVRGHDDTRTMLSYLDRLSRAEDERERPKHLERIVPKIIMALIPKLTNKPIVRTSTFASERVRLKDRRGALQALISELTDYIEHDGHMVPVHMYQTEAEGLLSDLFYLEEDENYDKTFFSSFE